MFVLEKELTKEQVLNALELHNFRDLTPEKMVEFLHKAKDMSKEEWKDAISKVPNFTRLMEGTLDLLKSIGEKTFAGNEDSMKRFYEHCVLVQQALTEGLKTATDMNEKMMIIDKMMVVANMLKEKDTENKFYNGFLLSCGFVCVGMIGFALYKTGLLGMIVDEID